jgi:hypothetical protein
MIASLISFGNLSLFFVISENGSHKLFEMFDGDGHSRSETVHPTDHFLEIKDVSSKAHYFTSLNRRW